MLGAPRSRSAHARRGPGVAQRLPPPAPARVAALSGGVCSACSELPQADHVRRTNAARKASSADASDFVDSRDCSAAMEAASPSLPRASCCMGAHQRLLVVQRTTVSGATAAGSPELPSATATLRTKPRRLARLMKEPAENSRHASGDMVIQSSGEGDTAHDFGTNAGSEAREENFWFYGRTVWEMCRYTPIEVALSTGSRTLRASLT